MRGSAGWVGALGAGIVAGLAVCGGFSCERRAEPAPRVVLYSSIDDYLLRDVVREFRERTGVEVVPLGDTEATKTTGLVLRLIAERERPRADVWWSGEPFGTIRLAREGVLEPWTSAAEGELPGGWPQGLRARDGTWYGFASRARVIVHNTVRAPQAPRTLRELAEPRWAGRVGMARPHFGTTGGHMAALLESWGAAAFEEWLRAMRAGGVRLYDGNSSVVRAVAQGEIDAGLTDTDDVWVGQRNGWPVGAAFEADETGDAAPPRWRSLGPMLVPATVARVRGGPNPGHAAALIDFLLSERVERMLAQSESRNIPVRAALRGEFSAWDAPGGRLPDLERVAERAPEALAIFDRVFGGG